MIKTNDTQLNRLVERYEKYTSEPRNNARAFALAKLEAEAQNAWCEVIAWDAPEAWGFDMGRNFKYVRVVMWPKTQRVKYPSRNHCASDWDYKQVCRAINWKAMKQDIKAQRAAGITGTEYVINSHFEQGADGNKTLVTTYRKTWRAA